MTTNPTDTQVCILAGGLGTRLRAAVPDKPKVLAPVGERAFLDYLVAYLFRQGFRRMVFLLGHMHQAVEQYLLERIVPERPDLRVEFSVEPQPLGTAGAVKLAEGLLDEQFCLINGDSYLEFRAAELLEAHRRSGAQATIAVRQVEDAARYGSVDVGQDGWVRGFREKDASAGRGLINAGAYVLNRSVIEAIPAGRAVSIEKEVFPGLLRAGKRVASCRQDGGLFIDIGTPESYRQFLAINL